MLAALGAGALGLGIVIGRRWSFLILLLASPIIWLASALALAATGVSAGSACLYALGPVVAAQLAYFAGAQMRLDAAVPGAGDRTRAAPAPRASGTMSPRPREPGAHPLAADDRRGSA